MKKLIYITLFCGLLFSCAKEELILKEEPLIAYPRDCGQDSVELKNCGFLAKSKTFWDDCLIFPQIRDNFCANGPYEIPGVYEDTYGQYQRLAMVRGADTISIWGNSVYVGGFENNIIYSFRDGELFYEKVGHNDITWYRAYVSAVPFWSSTFDRIEFHDVSNEILSVDTTSPQDSFDFQGTTTWVAMPRYNFQAPPGPGDFVWLDVTVKTLVNFVPDSTVVCMSLLHVANGHGASFSYWSKIGLEQPF